MPLHSYKPPDDLISRHFQTFENKEISGYLHILLESKFTDIDQVITDLKPYFESAHLDARTQFHDEIGIDLHPDADGDNDDDVVSYPRSLPMSARRGLFGEALTGLLTELEDFIGSHEWEIPVFLFRFHAEVGAYLYTLRRDPDRTRQVAGRKGDAISTGRRNTLAKPLGRCFILEGHSRTLVKLSCYRI